MFFRHWYKLLFRFVHVFDSAQSSGVLAGNDAKETKNTKRQKVAKKRNPYKQAAWKSTRPGKKSREPEVVALQNDTQKSYLKSQFLIKRSSGGMQYSYHEESCHLTKCWRILESNVGKKPGATPFPKFEPGCVECKVESVECKRGMCKV